jgi:adenine phosphoribosyltransferase
MNRSEKLQFIERAIRNVPDFPKEGIQFKDITTLLYDKQALKFTFDLLEEDVRNLGTQPDIIIGLESRGFLFGPMLAQQFQCSFVPVRKPGKLPYKTLHEDYELEYGKNRLEIHLDAISKGDKVLIHDDLIATGGSAKAAKNLVERCGGKVLGFSFIIELSFLNGKNQLDGYPIKSLITY